MGSCISKYHPNPTPTPQDKLVISQSPATTAAAINPLSHDLPISKHPFSSSSSSSSSSSNSSSISSCSYFSSSSSSKDGSFSNEFLLSCAQRNPHLIILDPHGQSFTKPKPTKHPIRRPQSEPKPARLPPEQSLNRTDRSLPVKRARSGSPPPLARQKSFRSGISSAVPPPRRTLSSPPPCRRMVGGPPSSALQKCEVGSSGNDLPLLLGARKEKLRALCPRNPSSVRLSSREEVASVHQISWAHPQEGKNGRGEVLSGQGAKAPLMEDIDNPLISMDCFIFL